MISHGVEISIAGGGADEKDAYALAQMCGYIAQRHSHRAFRCA